MGKLRTEVTFSDDKQAFIYETFSGKTVLDSGMADTFLEARYLSLRTLAQEMAGVVSGREHARTEDLLQDTLCDLWSLFLSDPKLAEQTDAYLLTKLNWSLRDGCRSSVIQENRVLSGSAPMGKTGDEVLFDVVGVEEGEDSALVETLNIRTFFASLSNERLRQVAQMVLVDDLPKKDIASSLGITSSRITQHMEQIGTAWRAYSLPS